jgi:hypothetical protein
MADPAGEAASVGRNSAAHSAVLRGHAYSLDLDAGLSPQSGSRRDLLFTVNLLDRRSNLLVANIDALRDSVRRVRARAPFQIDAWVVLPDHMHCLWTLPQGDANFPGRW